MDGNFEVIKKIVKNIIQKNLPVSSLCRHLKRLKSGIIRIESEIQFLENTKNKESQAKDLNSLKYDLRKTEIEYAFKEWEILERYFQEYSYSNHDLFKMRVLISN